MRILRLGLEIWVFCILGERGSWILDGFTWSGQCDSLTGCQPRPHFRLWRHQGWQITLPEAPCQPNQDPRVYESLRIQWLQGYFPRWTHPWYRRSRDIIHLQSNIHHNYIASHLFLDNIVILYKHVWKHVPAVHLGSRKEPELGSHSLSLLWFLTLAVDPAQNRWNNSHLSISVIQTTISHKTRKDIRKAKKHRSHCKGIFKQVYD